MRKFSLLLIMILLCGCSAAASKQPAEVITDVTAYPEYVGNTIIEYTEDESTDLKTEYTKYLYVGKDIADIYKQTYYFKYDSNIENVDTAFQEAISNYKTMNKEELEKSINELDFENITCEYNTNNVNIYCIDDNQDTYTVTWNENTYEFTITSINNITNLNYAMSDLEEEWKYIENVVIYKQ